MWLKDVEMQIESEDYTTKENLEKLFEDSDMKFLTFNYTKTLQKLYGIKKVIHIHNRVGQKLIFGHGKDNIMYNEFNDYSPDTPCIGSSFLDDMIMSFKKDTSSPMKKYNKFFKDLNYNIDKVYSYGFSYAKVDSIYIKNIISRISPAAIWYFTSFEARDTETLRIKKSSFANMVLRENLMYMKGN